MTTFIADQRGLSEEAQRLLDYIASLPPELDRWYAYHHDPGPLFRLGMQRKRVREQTRRKYQRR